VRTRHAAVITPWLAGCAAGSTVPMADGGGAAAERDGGLALDGGHGEDGGPGSDGTTFESGERILLLRTSVSHGDVPLGNFRRYLESGRLQEITAP
jgi:hypothetical protein